MECLLDKEHRERRNVGSTVLQDNVFAKIKSSATLSLGRIEHSNLSGCLKVRLSASTLWGENPDSRDDPAGIRYRDLDRDFVTVLVLCFRHIEY